jgi:hypothetical protein
VLLHQVQAFWIFNCAHVLGSLVQYMFSNVTTVVSHQTEYPSQCRFYILVLYQIMSRFCLTFSLLITNKMVRWANTQYLAECNFSFGPYTRLSPGLVQRSTNKQTDRQTNKQTRCERNTEGKLKDRPIEAPIYGALKIIRKIHSNKKTFSVSAIKSSGNETMISNWRDHHQRVLLNKFCCKKSRVVTCFILPISALSFCELHISFCNTD